MSKESAMALMTGQPTNNVNPSLVTGAMPTTEVASQESGLSPGLDVPQESAPILEAKGIDSDRFAALAKKEAARLQKEKEWEAKKAKEYAELEDSKGKIKDFYEKAKTFEEKRAQGQLVEAFKAVGLTDTEIFNMLVEIGEGKKPPTPEEIARTAAQEELAKFEEKQTKAAEEARKAKEQTLVSQYTTQISNAISKNPEKYEYANYYGEAAKELAMEFATANAKMNDELLSPEEIAQAVEEYYEEQDKLMAAAIKKRNPPQTGAEQKVEAADRNFVKKVERTRTLAPQAGQPLPPPMKTLTNKIAATAASTITRKETFEQKKERLIASLKNGTYVPKK